MANKKKFIVKIRTTNTIKEWDYEPNTEIDIPVLAKTAYNAERKVISKYIGSEYPNYVVTCISECDNFLFKPIL